MTQTLDELSGNAARATIIRTVIRQKFDLGEPLTPANINLALQGFTDFGEIGDDELAAAIAELPQPEAATSNPKPEVESAPAMSVDEWVVATKQVETDLVVARRIVLDAQQEQRQARLAFTNATIAFEKGKPITREQLQREHIAANQAYKQGLKDGTIQPPQRSQHATGTFRDRTRGHDGGPGASDRFARKSHTGQPFRGEQRFARGDVFDKTWNNGRGGFRPKLPSEL